MTQRYDVLLDTSSALSSAHRVRVGGAAASTAVHSGSWRFMLQRGPFNCGESKSQACRKGLRLVSR
jgi:hypothetical protein